MNISPVAADGHFLCVGVIYIFVHANILYQRKQSERNRIHIIVSIQLVNILSN